MKKIVLFIVVSFGCCMQIFSQTTNNTEFSFLQNSKIPSFSITTADSNSFSNNDLPKGKSVAIIYFRPDCYYCKAKAKFLSERMDSVQNAFFVWVSDYPVAQLHPFIDEFGLGRFSNVCVGQDSHAFLSTYFKATSTPYVAVYNNKGVFSKEFRNGTMVHNIIMAVNEH